MTCCRVRPGTRGRPGTRARSTSTTSRRRGGGDGDWSRSPAPSTTCSPAPEAQPGPTSRRPGRGARRAGRPGPARGGAGRPGRGAPGGTSGCGTRSTGRRRRSPGPPPVKTRVGFRLPADLVETARDAVAHLAGTADQTTLTALTERALRVELARLAIIHNNGQPFPSRDG
jgi:hypothetical protein